MPSSEKSPETPQAPGSRIACAQEPGPAASTQGFRNWSPQSESTPGLAEWPSYKAENELLGQWVVGEPQQKKKKRNPGRREWRKKDVRQLWGGGKGRAPEMGGPPPPDATRNSSHVSGLIDALTCCAVPVLIVTPNAECVFVG